MIQNLSDSDLLKLIQNAQINLLYTHQATGLKLKLLNSLYNGRHCLVNSNMVDGDLLNQCCIVKNSKEDLTNSILELMRIELSNEEIEIRKHILNEHYSNQKLTKKIIENITF